MSDDNNVMYDSPLDFMHEVAEKRGMCVAQSVLPLNDGTYLCACSCEDWEIIAPDRWTGLDLAREHALVSGTRAGLTTEATAKHVDATPAEAAPWDGASR